MDLQRHLHPLALGSCLEHTADGRGRETIAPNQHRHVGLGQHQLETQALGTDLRHFQLRLGRLVNQLDSHILKEIFQFIGDALHAGTRMHGDGPLCKAMLGFSHGNGGLLEICLRFHRVGNICCAWEIQWWQRVWLDV